MLRYLKMLAVAAAAALALTAVTSASAAEFHSEGSSTTLTGSQIGTDVFTTNGGTVECSEATYKGTQSSSTATTVTVAPTYSGCTALSGFASATIDMNGCEYQFNQPGAGGPTTYEGNTLMIVCPAGKEITVTASSFGTSKCVVHIPPQGTLGSGVIYHNEGTTGTRTIIVTISIEIEIQYTETAGTGFGACAGGSASNGSYDGEATVTGEHGSPTPTHTGIWIA